MTSENFNSRCQSLTKTGRPCRAAATEGGLCFFHANPKKAVELGRVGGLKNGRAPVETDPLTNLDSAEAVRDTVARLIADVYTGKLHARTAAGLAALIHLQLRAIVITTLEQRVTKVEKLLAAVIE